MSRRHWSIALILTLLLSSSFSLAAKVQSPESCQIAFHGILSLYQRNNPQFNSVNTGYLLQLLKSELEPLDYQIVPVVEAKTHLRVQYEIDRQGHRFWLQWVTAPGQVLYSESLADQSLDLAIKKNGKLSRYRYKSSLDLLVDIAKDRLFFLIKKMPNCSSLQDIQNRIQE
jgi:hypothetical protein